MNLVQDAMNASMPGTAKQFLGSVQPRPVVQMVMYIAILGLLGLVGTVIGLGVVGTTVGYGMFSATFKYPMGWAIASGVVGWIGSIVTVVGAGMLFAMLSPSVVGRQVSNEEAVTLIGLAVTPALIAGIFNIIPGIGGLIGILAALYAAFLFFQGSGVRFGADKALVATIVFIAAYLIIGFIIALIMGMIILAMYNPMSALSTSMPSYGGMDMSGYGYYR